MAVDVILSVQKHEALRAGIHHDIRLVIGNRAFSWATKKWPDLLAGKKIIGWQTPVHSKEYALSKKIVTPKGSYGAGVTTIDYIHPGKAEVGYNYYRIELENGDKFTIKETQQFGKGAWLIQNLTNSKNWKPLDHEEEHHPGLLEKRMKEAEKSFKEAKALGKVAEEKENSSFGYWLLNKQKNEKDNLPGTVMGAAVAAGTLHRASKNIDKELDHLAINKGMDRDEALHSLMNKKWPKLVVYPAVAGTVATYGYKVLAEHLRGHRKEAKAMHPVVKGVGRVGAAVGAGGGIYGTHKALGAIETHIHNPKAKLIAQLAAIGVITPTAMDLGRAAGRGLGRIMVGEKRANYANVPINAPGIKPAKATPKFGSRAGLAVKSLRDNPNRYLKKVAELIEN